MNKYFIPLPERTSKPRNTGVTMVIDSSLGFNAMEDMISIGEAWIDYVKLGWGTGLITPILKNKIELYKKHNIKVCLGGTFFEVAYANKKVAEFEDFVEAHGISLIEISDGSLTIPRDEKLEIINRCSKKFTVLSEYGNKDASTELIAPRYWAQHMKEELDAGAWKVIAEGRESGTAGMYRGSSELRTGLVDEIVNFIPQDDILWEAPLKAHQTWFIKKFGSNVSLGNIAPRDVLPLETLRLGLRSDTLLKFHGDGE